MSLSSLAIQPSGVLLSVASGCTASDLGTSGSKESSYWLCAENGSSSGDALLCDDFGLEGSGVVACEELVAGVDELYSSTPRSEDEDDDISSGADMTGMVEILSARGAQWQKLWKCGATSRSMFARD